MGEKKYYTYLLLTQNGTYYCGYTDDIERRYKNHVSGLGAKYTRANKPQKIAFLELFETKSEAMKEEYRIKHLTRKAKEDLVQNFAKMFPKMFHLAKKISFEYS